MRLTREYFIFAVLFLAVACAAFFLLPFAEVWLPFAFAPVYFRAFVWSSAYYFALGLAGISLVLLVRMDLVRERFTRFALYGLAAGMIALAWSDIDRGQQGSIAWAGQSKANLAAFDRAVQIHARKQGRPIFYYFHADWCEICPEFERNVLPRVAAETAPFVAVKMDVTDFDRWHGYIHGEYGVEATPTVILRDREGHVLAGTHFTGTHVSIRALQTALRTLGE